MTWGSVAKVQAGLLQAGGQAGMLSAATGSGCHQDLRPAPRPPSSSSGHRSKCVAEQEASSGHKHGNASLTLS